MFARSWQGRQERLELGEKEGEDGGAGEEWEGGGEGGEARQAEGTGKVPGRDLKIQANCLKWGWSILCQYLVATPRWKFFCQNFVRKVYRVNLCIVCAVDYEPWVQEGWDFGTRSEYVVITGHCRIKILLQIFLENMGYSVDLDNVAQVVMLRTKDACLLGVIMIWKLLFIHACIVRYVPDTCNQQMNM